MAEEHQSGQVTSTGDICEPCEFDNIICPAAGWCEDCDEKLCDNCHTAHRKLKQSRDHKFWSIEEMRVRKQRPRVTNKCEKHDGKRLEYFCVDHSQLGCGQCFVAAHRHCSKVICIADFKTIGSVEFEALEALLDNMDSRIHDIQEKAGRNKELSAREYDKAIADIEGAGQKLKSLIDSLVKEEIEKVRSAIDEDIRNMKEVEETSVGVTDKVNMYRELLTAEKTDNNQLFITMKHVQAETTNYLKSKLKCAEMKNTVTEKLFVLNPDLAAILEKVTELGTMKETKLNEMETATDEVLEMLEVSRFQQTKYGWGYEGKPDAIQVSTDKNVRLLYVLLYPCDTGDTDVELTVMEGTKCLLTCKSTHTRGTGDVVDVKVVNRGGGHGVTLRAGQFYDIVVTIKGCRGQFGKNGKGDVTVDGVKFIFGNSKHSRNSTNVNSGQIAKFKFAHL